MAYQPRASESALKARLRGLYAITPQSLPTAPLLAKARAALEGGARVLQYRAKDTPAALRLSQARALYELCRAHAALFVVNDDVALAGEIEAEAIHLGRDDAPLCAARARLGAGVLIGVSCYNDYARAQQACGEGADYVAFGSFFPSPTKPQAVRAHVGLIERAKRELGLPVVAIGGITLDNALPLIRAGADCVAVVSALFEVDDVRSAAADFAALFTRTLES